MDSKRIIAIERWNLLFTAIFSMTAWLLLSRSMAIGIALGAAISCINFWGLHKLITSSLQSKGKKRVVLQFILIFKLGILMSILWLAATFLPVSPISLAIGFSVFLVSIAAETARFSLSKDNAETSLNG